MKSNKINEGNLYNVEQKVNPVQVANTFQGSIQGLGEWNKAIRKEVMQKLRGYAPEKIDEIIQKTFGNLGNIKGLRNS